MKKRQKGSEWRKWDLHIHTPKTKLSDGYKCDPSNDVWNEYVGILENSDVQVFGVTDYFACDNYFNLTKKYKLQFPETTKTFFPNIEFRLSDAINNEGDSPHLHVVFDNDPEICSESKLLSFLSNLNTQATDSTGARVPCVNLKSKSDFASATVSRLDVIDALKKTFGSSKPYILIFPAKNDGIRSTDKKSPRKILISDELDKCCNAFFGDRSSVEYFLSSERYDNGESSPKPVFSGSDAHSFEELERLTGDVSGYPSTWIKADKTFRGLKQTLFEPKSRVYIGELPPVLERVNREATKFIDRLNIKKTEKYNGQNGHWFERTNIQLNPELTAIIGNKGSGKSAIADILGLLGDSRHSEHFSFLTNKQGNKKFKQAGYAENFEAELTWESTNTNRKNLNEPIDNLKPETVKYLPQNFFEQLTNEIEVSAFQREVEEVVFSHVDTTDRMEKSTFKELEDFKTSQSKSVASSLKTQLRELNFKILEMEGKSTPSYKKSLEEKLEQKKKELQVLESSLPQPVTPPAKETPEQEAINLEIVKLSEIQETISSKEKIAIKSLTENKNKLQKLISVLERLEALEKHISSEKNEIQFKLDELAIDLKIEQIIGSVIDYSDINTKIEAVKLNIKKLERNSDSSFDKESEFNNLENIDELRKANLFVSGWIEELKNRLSAPHKRFQNFLQKTAEINQQISSLKGDTEVPADGTVNSLEQQLNYLNKELSEKLNNLKLEREEIARKIFETKEVVLHFYENLKESVEGKLNGLSDPDFKVSINASFILSDGFNEKFLGFINKNRVGPFKGNEEATKLLQSMVDIVDWNDFDSINTFILEVISIINDGGNINEQISSLKEFYDFLFSLNYFDPKYELRLDNKNLNQLSPGEKGLLLLVFYLHLDKENKPLIIDQPEDNLDNDSIFTVLAKCIKAAKERRQVILITHNPNLAVGADAELVIYVKLNKAGNYKFTHHGGAIEEDETNKNIVKVLEGSRPAFIQRRLAYQIK